MDNKWVLLFMLMSLGSTAAQAGSENEERGVVRMNGSILETPCAIGMEDRDQQVELGTETTGELLHDGAGPYRPFTISLMNCRLDTATLASWFRVTFDGLPDGDNYAVNGASGIGVQIVDEAGEVASPGKPMPVSNITPGMQILKYKLRLKADNHHLQAGDYRTTIKFKIDYF